MLHIAVGGFLALAAFQLWMEWRTRRAGSRANRQFMQAYEDARIAECGFDKTWLKQEVRGAKRFAIWWYSIIAVIAVLVVAQLNQGG